MSNKSLKFLEKNRGSVSANSFSSIMASSSTVSSSSDSAFKGTYAIKGKIDKNGLVSALSAI